MAQKHEATRLVTYKILGAIAFSIMLSAAIVTLIDTPLGWWKWFSEPDDVNGPVSTNLIALPTLRPPATLPPTPTPSLERMLEAAKSLKTSSERDHALRIVAEAAVKESDYAVAIEAGAASPSSSGRSETLTFVARCAALEGMFTAAVKAADKIPVSSVHDSTKIEILAMQSQQEHSKSIGSVDIPPTSDCKR